MTSYLPAKKKDPWDIPLSKRTIESVLELCSLSNKKDCSTVQLLDFGCGNGRYLEAFATRIPQQNLVGVEIDTDRVAQVRLKGFTCHTLDIHKTKLPFERQRFDIVFSSNVIEHIPRGNYLKYLVEIRQVLRPGGLFILGTPNYPIKRLYDIKKAFITGLFRYYFFDDPTHCNKLSFSQLEKDLKPLFGEVELWPTYLFYEHSLSFLQNPKIRQLFRILGDKIMGRCKV